MQENFLKTFKWWMSDDKEDFCCKNCFPLNFVITKVWLKGLIKFYKFFQIYNSVTKIILATRWKIS